MHKIYEGCEDSPAKEEEGEVWFGLCLDLDLDLDLDLKLNFALVYKSFLL